MTRRGARRGLVSALAALLVLTAGCGGDQGEEGQAQTQGGQPSDDAEDGGY